MKSEERELEQAILGCKKNKASSQQFIYKLLYSRMLGVCYRYARSEDEAKDMLQDGFIKLFEKIKMFNSTGSFEGWARRIFINNAIDTYRKNKKEILIDNSIPLPESNEDDIPSAYEGLSVSDVVDALQDLSPAYQMTFNLYVMEGYSHQEIADELGISVGTSKSNYAKAKAKMKKLLLEKINKSND